MTSSFHKICKDVLLVAMAVTVGAVSIAHAQSRQSAVEQEIINSEAFLSSHPDLMNRMRGMQALERGEPERAAIYFKRAAWYADKQAQAIYAEMLWDGRGVPQDRSAAYAWMDLAAERQYKLILRFRERYWSALSETERQRALEVGRQVYAEYGDEIAQPRLEKVLRRAARNVTGSRTGFVGALTIVIPGPGEGTVIDGSTFYDKRYWEPAQYWKWQKEVVEGVKEGKVIVGDLLKTREKIPAEKPVDPVD
ncbi:MAG: sel1 repeat family protein [Xanthomonadaceae bacterium]|nr:sel1 repeat family protein [Xanthomonadaceae bacterium]